MTITEFLEARIAEDEAAARAAKPAPWYVDDEEQTVRAREYAGEIMFDRSTECRAEWAETFKRDAEFIARHDPARVLAECAAKRAIIKQHEEWPVLVEKKPEFREDATDPQNMAYRVTQEMAWLTEREYVKRFGVEAPTTNMILALATVYADHPDYRQEWAHGDD